MEEIKYLVLTILIETPVAIIILREIRWPRVWFACVCVNLVSHPIAWLLVSHGFNWWTVEGLVAIFESAIFIALFPSANFRAGLTSVAMNFVSALIGLFIQRSI